MNTQDKLGIGIVGCGDIGWTNAMAVAQSSSATVSCTFDPNVGGAQALARKVGARATESYEALLERSDLGAVFLSVPHHLHAPLAVQAATAGKHVLIEKPLANTREEATQIISACKKHGVRLSVNYSFRYSAQVEAVGRVIGDGAIGRPAGVSVQHLIHKGKAYWSHGYFGRTPDDWRAKKAKAGGGILIMGIVHNIDYMQAILNSRITRVYAEYATLGTVAEVEDTISLSCRFENGAVGSWCASTCHPGAALITERIWGEHGTLVLKPDPPGYFITRRQGVLSPGRFQRLAVPPETNFRAKWVDAFVQAVRDQRDPEIGWREGWQMTALVDAAYESQEKGRAVIVQERPSEDATTRMPA
jgi:predicted dehydrogenase